MYIIILLSVYSPWFPNVIIFEVKKRSRDSMEGWSIKPLVPFLVVVSFEEIYILAGMYEQNENILLSLLGYSVPILTVSIPIGQRPLESQMFLSKVRCFTHHNNREYRT